MLELTKAKAEELGISPKRSLGQNFLVSEAVVTKIVDAVMAFKPRQIIEVGPGLGALTEAFLQTKTPLQLIELDRQFAEFWRRRQVGVNEHDALKVDWESLSLPENTVLASNLPYQISTHLVVDRCFGPKQISAMVLMFQKEVAQRFLARPRSKAYGMLSVMAQSFWHIERLLEAGPRDFWPAPKIASQVLVMRRKTSDLESLAVPYLSFLKQAFAQRRKFLLKNISGFKPHIGERLPAIFAELKLSVKVRAEELSVEDLERLFRALIR